MAEPSARRHRKIFSRRGDDPADKAAWMVSTCGECAYWERTRSRDAEQMEDEGLCRRRAPVAIGSADILPDGQGAEGIAGLLAAWPRTFQDADWCGDFRQKVHDSDPDPRDEDET